MENNSVINIDCLSDLTKETLVKLCVGLGVVLGMITQATIGLSGLIIFSGVYFIFKYTQKSSK